MIVDYFKYDLYRKYQTSDGVTYTPLDEYQAVMTDYNINEDCGYIPYSNLHYDNITGSPRPVLYKVINKQECLSALVWRASVIQIQSTGPFTESVYDTNDDVIGLQNNNMTDWSSAFEGCKHLYGIKANNWDMSKVTDMSNMFLGCSLYDGMEIDKWNTESVTNFSEMFSNCRFNTINISNWNTSSAINLSGMFSGCTNLNEIDIKLWNVQNVTDVSHMFDGCSSLTSLDLSGWRPENLTNINKMFTKCTKLQTINLSGWNCNKLEDMGHLFQNLNVTTINLTNFDTSNVTDMTSLFYNNKGLTSIIGIENLNVKKVEKLSSLVDGCNSLFSLDLSGWEAPNLTTLYGAFSDSSLHTLYIDKLNLRNVNLQSIFYNTYLSKIRCTRLSMYCLYSARSNTTGLESTPLYNGTIGTVGSGANWEITDYKDNVIDATFEIETKGSYPIANNYKFFDKIIVNDETEVSFFNNSSIKYDFPSTGSFNIKYHTYGNIGDTINMFLDCKLATSIDLSNWDTSEINDMTGMFMGCYALKTLNISNFNTSMATNMSCMFHTCSHLESLDVSHFDTSNVTDMSVMFYYCSKVPEINVENFNTQKVTSMRSMFYGCQTITSLNLTNFDTSNVTDMQQMFYQCEKITSLDLSSFNTSNVTEINSMFTNCTELTYLNLSNFDMSKIKTFYGMFKRCDKLNHIKCTQSFKDWCITKQDTINLPESMREGGSGTWEIV